jgi:hypothetical protein
MLLLDVAFLLFGDELDEAFGFDGDLVALETVQGEVLEMGFQVFVEVLYGFVFIVF